MSKTYRLYAIRPLERIPTIYESAIRPNCWAIVDPLPIKEGDQVVFNHATREVGYYRQFTGWALV